MRKIFAIVLSSLAIPFVASAHGVGQVYNLPIPLKYYLGAAGLVVAVSFFVFAYFLSSEKKSVGDSRVYRVSWLPTLITILRALVVVAMLFMIWQGLFGVQNSSNNPVPTIFWVLFLQGFSILSLFIGNIWYKINPFKTLSKLLGLPKGDKTISSWAAVILILALYWFELCSGASFLPLVVGTVILFYAIFNLLLNYTFSNWFRDGEVFNVLFSFIGKLAFFEIGEDNRSIVYSPLASRLQSTVRWSDLGIACVLLAGTSFDSFKETTVWFKMLKSFGINHFSNLVVPNTLGLILSVVPFVVVYLLLMYLMELMTRVGTWQSLSKHFVYALIPIAFGYTLAHNFSLMVLTIPQLFGKTTQLILQAKAIWFVEIGLVVLAHVVGTLFAHLLATQIMPNPKKVLISQYPTLILMVAFTVTTLWLLAQPLVIFQ